MAVERSRHDVVVVGGGNAALSAALSAAEHGADVLMLERAPEKERGGNSILTDGLMRFVYDDAETIRRLVPELSDAELSKTDFGSYTANDFYDDMARLTHYRTDPDLCEILVENSTEAIFWLSQKGVRFFPNYRRQAYEVDGKFRFWGGAAVAAEEGGYGLVNSLYRAADANDVTVWYGARAVELQHSAGRVSGVVVRNDGADHLIEANAVILACGGFEANAEWRARYLGPGWDLAKVRGTRYNTGDGLQMALEIGAQPYGHWSGCHATAWERNATDFGDLEHTPHFQRNSYPLGIVVNARGERFLDEGADYRNYTYAKYGQEVLRQPGQVAWQIFDARVEPMLRDEYFAQYVTKYRSDTIEGLLAQLEDEVDTRALAKTIEEFNRSVRTDIPFDPNVKDGRRTEGLAIPKSNWANPLDTPPFVAYEVTCGITFTFGGVEVDKSAQVLDTGGSPIEGLYAAGEMVGGLFYFNYPGASGLTSGTVFGRLAGRSGAQAAVSSKAETVARRK